MAVNYSRLFHQLIDMGISNNQLADDTQISSNIITRLKQNEYVSLEAIECALQLKKILNCFYRLVSKNSLGVLIKRYTVYSEPLNEKENDD